MRRVKTGKLLRVRAIGGLHVVLVAWDFKHGAKTGRDDLLGFAIERTQFASDGQPAERYWLRGIKRFTDVDQGLPPGSPVPTSIHPVQSFQWGDYTAKPDTEYAYRIVPVFGEPKRIELDDARATTVRIRTEGQADESAAASGPRHDIFFNRGAAGSQAYTRIFQDQKPDPDKPESAQMKWLSRGLYEGLTGFIGKAKSSEFQLRAMLYEFQYKGVGEAFKRARDAGADVDIRYEAQSYQEHNEEMIHNVGIGNICKPQKPREGIRHNKFIVLLKNNLPIAVWTGSTNISTGGIFGHSNVGHVIYDHDISRRFFDYWTELADPDVTTGKLRKWATDLEATPAIGQLPAKNRILTMFSPRDLDQKTSPTLQWYAGLVAGAKEIACITFAFNFDPVFSDAFGQDTDSLNYLMFDKSPKKPQQEFVEKKGNTVIAVGQKFEDGWLENFLGEELTGFNRNLYIHDKFLLVDPLGNDPITVTGTGNFSRPSQIRNDENMLVIRANERVADIYLGEFMRIFDHHYARYITKKIREQNPANSGGKAGYLKEKQGDWLPGHFAEGGRKALRRKYFVR